MDIVNQIKDGIHIDNNVYDQPPHSMRDNLNGMITDLGSGNFKWSNIKGNTLSFTIGTADKYFSHCKIKDRLFIITLTTDTLTVRFIEIIFTGETGAPTTRYSIANTELNLSYTYPIRTIWGFYENEDIQRIYWSDYNNPPRCVNVENFPAISKFIDYFPVIDKVYGSITDSYLTAGGTVKAGTLFFVWRFYTDDGYYTDWSYLSNPILVTGGSPGTTLDKYQEYQGMAPDDNSSHKVTIEVSDIDSDFDKIQVCVFYSNDLNISIPGVIFYDGAITSNIMEFTYLGTENFGTVTIDDLIITSVKIDKLKESTVAKKQNVISCLEERAELDLPEYMEADIHVTKKALPLDITGYPGVMTASTDSKALTGVPTALSDQVASTLRRGQWYKAITETTWNDGSGAIVVSAGDLFYVSVYSTATTYVSGLFVPAVVKRKYLLAGGTPGGDINTNYRFEYELLGNEYLDWKSQKVSKTYKSYPQGETVRLGILFFDKTGRPFQVRHLRNTDVTYGPGDTLIPKRDETNPMLTMSGWHDVLTDGYYDNICASLQHLTINNLDITDIKDEIGGFMIVRAPIIRQYLAMGILVPTYRSTNDIYSFPGLYPYSANANNYFGCYDLYCPEDMFNAKDFTIQPGDELENIVYLSPYAKEEVFTLGAGTFRGFGRREMTEGHNFYQKFVREILPTLIHDNGILGVSHEILAITKHEVGDDQVRINPLDATKLYNKFCAGYDDNDNTHAGINGKHATVMLDITDSATDIKGPSQDESTVSNPMALLVSVKRPNADPYGGYSDSSIANSVYMAIGHYQPINASVLADIESGGTYIFNGIEIFGGDTFIQLFDTKRLYGNYDLSTPHLGHGIIFPVETKMNISMREGEHIAKTRSYDPNFNVSGLQVRTGNTILEEFNYNDGYSSDDIHDYYLPVPFNYVNTNKYLSRIRYSPEKNYGEKRDSFRMFLANDYIDLDPNKGEITNIRLKNDKLIYWQFDEVGYIPIRERALTQSSAGQSVQLGVGGIFERYDALKNYIGNSHQFGLIESPIGFHWYDSRRKLFLSINDNFQLTPDSILKGLDSFFQNDVPDGFEQYDNPLNTYGIIGGYDVKTRMIFVSFIMAGSNKTIGINVTLNKFVGFFDIYPKAYIEHKNHLFQIKSTLLTGYIHGTGTYMNFFGTQYQAYVSIIVKEDSNEAKIFDTFELIGNDNFFTKVLYENSEQSIEETVSEYTTGSCVVLDRNYGYKKKRWLGNFPKVSRERLNDGYLKITFKMDNPYLVELFQLKSTVRKQY